MPSNIQTRQFSSLRSTHKKAVKKSFAPMKALNYAQKNVDFKMNPWWVTGFTDGEGSFTVSLTRDNRLKSRWRVRPLFQISLHKKDSPLLEQIKNFLGVGRIYKLNNNAIIYKVYSEKELLVIQKHFEKFPLQSQKSADYELWSEVLNFVKNKEHLTMEGLRKILAIRASMNWGLTPELKAAFPSIIPVKRPGILGRKIPDSNWLAGFISAEGCFFINITNSVTYSIGFQVQLLFQITQHSRDELLMKILIVYFDCGNIYKRSYINKPVLLLLLRKKIREGKKYSFFYIIYI